jgi:HEAT repeat protein
MKRWQVIAVCALAGLAIVVVACMLRQREPVYQGKSLRQWTSEASIGVWPRQSPVAADEAIRQIGTNGFPIITKLLRSHDSALKSRLLALYYKQSLIRIHISTQHERQSCALAACWALGSEAKALVPEIAKALNHMDPYFRPAFELWLQQLGSDADAAVPALITILEDKKNPTRLTVAQTLGKISMQRRDEVIPVLTACRQDTNAMVRFWAEDALKALGAPQQTTLTKTL